MKRRQQVSQQKSGLLNATYYGVLCISMMSGLLAYNAGATLEGTLIRVVVTLLACTILGYLINVALWLSAHNPQPSAAPSARINLVTDDDPEPAQPAGQGAH